MVMLLVALVDEHPDANVLLTASPKSVMFVAVTKPGAG